MSAYNPRHARAARFLFSLWWAAVVATVKHATRRKP